MARFYDIAERMKTGREKPTVKLDDGHEYKINTGKSAVLYIQGISDDESLNEFEKMDKIFKVSLGEEAAQYIDSLELPTAALSMISNVVMAAIADVDLEQMEQMAKEEANKHQKKSK